MLEARGKWFLVRPPQHDEVRFEAVGQCCQQLVDRSARRIEGDVEREVHAIDQHAVCRPERAQLDTAEVLAIVEALER